MQEQEEAELEEKRKQVILFAYKKNSYVENKILIGIFSFRLDIKTAQC